MKKNTLALLACLTLSAPALALALALALAQQDHSKVEITAADQALGIATERTRIIPGHGPLSNKPELKAYRDMLATVSGRIRQMIAMNLLRSR